MTPIQLVVFDLAGTTIDDGTAVADCLYDAAVEFDLDTTREEIITRIGTNKIHLYQFLIARAQGRDIPMEDFERIKDPASYELAQQVFARYSALMLDYYRSDVTPMAGAEDTFAWLHERGIQVATNTGFHHDVTTVLMERLGWLDQGLVDLAVDVEDVPGGVGRPAPFMIFHAMRTLNVQSVRTVIKVGDTPADMLEGTNAGCRGVVGVLSGPLPLTSWCHYPHTHILPSVKDLPALIERDFA